MLAGEYFFVLPPNCGLHFANRMQLFHTLLFFSFVSVFWYATRELLNKHEMQRFHLLKCVDTDAGRGRAWLRSTLNEHSLEKFLHLLLDNSMLLR